MKEKARNYYLFSIGWDLFYHTLIMYWFVGSDHPVVPPLKYVKPFDFVDKIKSSMQGMLRQMKKLISGVLASSCKDGK